MSATAATIWRCWSTNGPTSVARPTRYLPGVDVRPSGPVLVPIRPLARLTRSSPSACSAQPLDRAGAEPTPADLHALPSLRSQSWHPLRVTIRGLRAVSAPTLDRGSFRTFWSGARRTPSRGLDDQRHQSQHGVALAGLQRPHIAPEFRPDGLGGHHRALGGDRADLIAAIEHPCHPGEVIDRCRALAVADCPAQVGMGPARRAAARSRRWLHSAVASRRRWR